MAAKKQKKVASCKHDGSRQVDVIKFDKTEYKANLCDGCIDTLLGGVEDINLGIGGVRV